MANKYIGVDLGNFHIKAVTLMENHGKFELEKVFSLPMPEDSISDGTIMNYADIAAQIVKVMQSGEFEPAPVSLAVKGAITKHVRVPYASRSTLDIDAYFFANQYMSIDIEEYSIDYKIVHLDATKNLAKIIFAALKKESISDYLSLMESAQQKLAVMDAESLALCSLYSTLKLPDTGISAIIDIGHVTTDIVFLQNGLFSYCVSAKTAGSLCSKLILDKTKSPAESIDMVKANPDAFPAGQEVVEIIKNEYLPALLSEVDLAVSKFKLQGGDVPERIYLTGGGATTIGLKEKLEDTYHAEVAVMTCDAAVSFTNPTAMQITELKPAFLNMAVAMALR